MSAPSAEPDSWLSRIHLLDDDPIGRSETRDLLGFSGQVDLVLYALTHARGPMVIHVDGAWGRGKSSFCRLLETKIRRLIQFTSGDSSHDSPDAISDIRSSWFVASDDKAGLSDGLLYAIAAAVTDHDAEESARVLRTWGSSRGEDDVATVTRRAQLRDWIEHELGWAEDNAAPSVNTTDQAARDVLKLPDGTHLTLPLRPRRRRLACIFVDDLDRCSAENARSVMDSIRGFVSCRGLTFVVAADQRVLERAFEVEIQHFPGEGGLSAAEAIEKYVRHRVVLPGLDKLGKVDRLIDNIRSLQHDLFTGEGWKLLRGPGAALEDGVGIALARAFSRTMTLRRLKRLLNELAVDLANAADACGLSPHHLEDGRLECQENSIPPPSFEGRAPVGPDEFIAYFLEKIVTVTARHVWPGLFRKFETEHADFRARVFALVAIGRQRVWWQRNTLRQVFDLIVEPELDHSTPLQTKIEMCIFLHESYTSVKPPTDEASSTQERIPEPIPSQIHVESEAIPEPKRLRAVQAPQPSEASFSPVIHDIESARPDLSFVELELLVQRFAITCERAPPRLGLTTPALQLVALVTDRGWTPFGSDDELASSLVHIAMALLRRGEGERPAFELLNLARPLNDARSFTGPYFAETASHIQERYPFPGQPKMSIRDVVEGLTAAFKDLDARPSVWAPETEYRLHLLAARWATTNRSFVSRIESWFEKSMATAIPSRGSFNAGIIANILSIVDTYKHWNKLRPRARAFESLLIEAARKSPLQYHSGIATSVGPAQRLRVAEFFASVGTDAGMGAATEFYQELRGTKLWTPSTLHNFAQTQWVRGYAPAYIGRLWELAYRHGLRNPALRRNFGQFLTEQGHTDVALRVLNGDPLPSPEVWSPFPMLPPDFEDVRPEPTPTVDAS